MSNVDFSGFTRVTTILYPFSGLEKVPKGIVENAANRGTKVHKICESIVVGFGELCVDEEVRGYVESFKKWWKKGHEVIDVEKRFMDNELKITGQVDFIIKTKEGLAIVDLKTSYKPSLTWPAQGAAYAYLAKRELYDIQKIFFIHLNKLGNDPKIHEYPVDDDFFLSIFRVWNHFYKAA